MKMTNPPVDANRDQSGFPGAVETPAVGGKFRQRAEAQFAKNVAQLSKNQVSLSLPAMQQHVHELSIHQIELEMQNEELRRLQLELAASWANYIDLYDFAPVGYCIVSEPGLILQANVCAASLLDMARRDLLNQPISRFICNEDQDVFYLQRKQLQGAAEAQPSKSFELRMKKRDGKTFWVQLTITAAQDAAGAPLLRIALNDITERKQAEEGLRSLSAQLMMSEERERCLLAQELHDNLGQLLAAIKIKLSTLQAGALKPAIDNVVALVDQADHSVRMIIQQWSPPLLQVLGFFRALQWLSEDIRCLYGIAVHVDIEPCAQTLNDAIQALIFRSIRELLINAAKHAKGSAAHLSVRCDGHRLVLAVRDTGDGFDPAQSMAVLPNRLTFGLRSISERMLALGGEMNIDSSPGNGTTITLTIPCTAVANLECPQA